LEGFLGKVKKSNQKPEPIREIAGVDLITIEATLLVVR